MNTLARKFGALALSGGTVGSFLVALDGELLFCVFYGFCAQFYQFKILKNWLFEFPIDLLLIIY